MNSSQVKDNVVCLDNKNTTFIPKFKIYHIILLFIFYIFIASVGLFFTIKISINCVTSTNTSNALYGVMSTSVLGCSIYYIRKLYKMCIGNNISFIEKNSPKKELLENIGSIVYFLMRPLFSLGFSIIVFLGLRSGMISVSNNMDTLTLNYVYLSMFISFFIGFSSGKFLESLQDKSENLIDNLWNKK